MAVTTNFIDLKGNAIRVISTTPGAAAGDDTTIVLGEFLPDGAERVPNVRTTVTVRAGVMGAAGTAGSQIRVGSGAPADTLGIDGDYYLDTGSLTTDNFYMRAAGTYTLIADFKGEKGDTGDTGPSGTASVSEFSVTTVPGENAYVSLLPVTNPALASNAATPGISLTFTGGDKFVVDPGGAFQTFMIFARGSTAIDPSGFIGAGGSGGPGEFQNYFVINTEGLTPAQQVTEFVSRNTLGARAPVANAANGETDATWAMAFAASADGNSIEIRSPGNDLSAVGAQTNGGSGWASTDVAATLATDLPTAGIAIATGSLQYLASTNEAYVYLGAGYTTAAIATDLPGSPTGNGADWHQITN